MCRLPRLDVRAVRSANREPSPAWHRGYAEPLGVRAAQVSKCQSGPQGFAPKIFRISRRSSKITRMSSPGFQWRVRGLVRAALLDDSGQTNACCALLVTPTRGPERLEGCGQPPHQQERTRPEVAKPIPASGTGCQRLEFACSQNWALRGRVAAAFPGCAALLHVSAGTGQSRHWPVQGGGKSGTGQCRGQIPGTGQREKQSTTLLASAGEAQDSLLSPHPVRPVPGA